MPISAIIVAAGAGKRLGTSTPKGFVRLAGKPLFLYSLGAVVSHGAISDAVLVVQARHVQKAKHLIKACGFRKKVTVVPGGRERWQSVANGISAVASEWVLIHDAARPFVTKAVIDAVCARKNRFDCVITATPEVDTIRESRGIVAGTTVDRSKLVKVGTPQLFRRSLLLRALSEAPMLPSPPTDEAVLVQRSGLAVALAPGDPLNFKITAPADLVLAEALVAYRRKK
jgi:2-C-methyl-D-erythritol 4-phosphate cytidylyltransferase